jgi:hypothetical protein
MDIKKGEILVLLQDLKYSCGTKYGYKGQLIKSQKDYMNWECHIDVLKLSGKDIRIPVFIDKQRTIRKATLIETLAFNTGLNNISQIVPDTYLNQ